MSEALLDLRNLSLCFQGFATTHYVLNKVNLKVLPGEILGLVGESGCGKSVLARSVLALLPSPPARVSGEILFKGEDILKASARRLRALRGAEISMIFQEPMTSLNPVLSVGRQMGEVLRLHKQLSRREAAEAAEAMLRQVNMPDPARTLAKYPHELSGGMRQRVMIAMELSCSPSLLIADEPTTALDVTVQGQVLAILAELTRSQGTSTLFITHDMGVVAQLCDRVAVMYAGHLVEMAATASLFAQPLHPYSAGLILAIPTLRDTRQSLPSIPGAVPSLTEPPQGCPFAPRCPRVSDMCPEVAPPLQWEQGRAVACHHPLG